MPQFKNTSALMAYLRQAVDKALTTDVFPVVRATEVDKIISHVYEAYHPKCYERRGAIGGFQDPSNIKIAGGSAMNGTLMIVNTTPPNPYLNGVDVEKGYATVNKDMNEVITTAVGYDYWPDPFPRPFISPTVEQLEQSGTHIKALKKGLKKQGITVR